MFAIPLLHLSYCYMLKPHASFIQDLDYQLREAFVIALLQIKG